ncbi:MAG: apolipoprotein N-acyltransferase [bacterium]|nr:apolipoprotein N-acyltransferase [bacterium]
MRDPVQVQLRRRRFGRPSRATGLALLAGMMVTGGLPPHAWTGVLVPAGLALLMALVLAAPRPARLAWFFALAHQSTLLYWLFLLDPAKSIPTRALVPIQAGLTILYVSVFYLGWGWLCGRARQRLGSTRALLLMPALWTAMEAVRSFGELGFPWCLTGSSTIGTPFMVLVRGAGELGLGCALAFTAATIVAWTARGGDAAAIPDAAHAARRRARRPLAIVTALAWTALAAGAAMNPAPPPPPASGPFAINADSLLARPLRVAAVQADVSLADKWDTARIDSTRVPYAALTKKAAAAGAEFVVWAETAVPGYLRYDVANLNWLRRLVRESGVWLYAGFPDGDRRTDGRMRLYNSSGLLSPDGVIVDRYAKHHLLPIGEAMPFQRYLPFLGQLNVGQAEWDPGDPPRALVAKLPDGHFPFSGLICFESVFGSLARDSVRRGSRCLAVITNDGWFGRTAGPRQHAWLARLRAVECGVPVIRCANNGISFIADRDGRLLGWLELGERGVVSATISPGDARTGYVRWGSAPVTWFLVLWVLLTLAGPWGRRAGESEVAP